MKCFAFLSLNFNFNIKFQYIKLCIPYKIPGEVVGGCGMAWGWIKLWVFYISPDLMFYITFVSGMHFHNHLSVSISPKILKEIFAE